MLLIKYYNEAAFKMYVRYGHSNAAEVNIRIVFTGLNAANLTFLRYPSFPFSLLRTAVCSFTLLLKAAQRTVASNTAGEELVVLVRPVTTINKSMNRMIN